MIKTLADLNRFNQATWKDSGLVPRKVRDKWFIIHFEGNDPHGGSGKTMKISASSPEEAEKLARDLHHLKGNIIKIEETSGYTDSTRDATLSEVKSKLSAVGITVKKTDEGEFKVNFAGGSESTAYYASDLDDALGTGLQMSKEKRKDPTRDEVRKYEFGSDEDEMPDLRSLPTAASVPKSAKPFQDPWYQKAYNAGYKTLMDESTETVYLVK